MYKIIFTSRAERDFRKLSKDVRERIGSAIERIKLRPEDFVSRLTGCPYFKLRVGDYRLILDVKRDLLIILVLEVGHRRNVYDKL